MVVRRQRYAVSADLGVMLAVGIIIGNLTAGCVIRPGGAIASSGRAIYGEMSRGLSPR